MKRGGGTEKNLQNTNNAKVNSFATKMNEVMRKFIEKNKASKELYILNEKAKIQVSKQINNCAQGRQKNYVNCKIEASKKKCNTNFFITRSKSKTTAATQEKNTSHKNNVYNTKTTIRQNMSLYSCNNPTAVGQNRTGNVCLEDRNYTF